MRGKAALANWPVAVVVVSATALSLAAAQRGWPRAEAHGPYPLRIALPPEGSGAALALKSDAQSDLMDPAQSSQENATAAETDREDFRDAFATLAVASAKPLTTTRSAPPSPPTESDGVLGIRFNLADPYAGDGATAPIEVRKGIRVNGADVGDATIRVTDGATLAIAREELGRLLAAAGRADAAQSLTNAGRFITFDRIRQAGLSVRYDAASDRVLVAG